MDLITILVLWTWGITPVWVNIIGTIICVLRILVNMAKED